jgi:Flp pilus assembly protein TadG
MGNGDRKMRTLVKHNKGQSLVEFALVIPMLLLLMVGIMEFSRVWMTQNILTGAAREGARAAAVGGDGDAAARQVLASANLDSDKATIRVTNSVSPYGDVTVTVAYPFPVSVPGFFSKILALVTWGTKTGSLPEWDATDIPLASSTTMRQEF